MKKIFEKKINVILIIALAILVVVTIAAVVIWQVTTKNVKQEISYEDKVNCNNYFENIAINLDLKRVKRDGQDTTLKEEFGISESEENNILSSEVNIREFFQNSSFEVSKKENIMYIKNDFQTKKIIVISDNIDENKSFDAVSSKKMPSGMYILEYDTKRKTKAAYEYFSSQGGVKVLKDEISYVSQISDESQTMYGGEQEDLPNSSISRGITMMGLDNFKNIINENGNPSDVIVSTIGYGVCIENEFFKDRISDRYYNFIDNKKEVQETISQGSRIAEVITDSTTNNVKLLPIKVVNDQGYTSTSALVMGIEYASKLSDIICYELVNKENEAIDKALKNAYKENKIVCAVTTKGENSYPASYSTTIATASLNKNLEIATYSGSGDYIDFSASSTDIKEIFNNSSSVSRWSGAQYSNAFIASEIALIKTYNKDFSIKEIYNELIKYSKDLGDSGKDKSFGNGIPIFSTIKISDIDKKAPEMQDIQVNNEIWEQLKKINVVAKDNIRLTGWQVSTSEEEPKEWNEISDVTPNLETQTEIKDNGKFFIWVKDSAGNTTNKQIEVSKIDNKGPNITYTINRDTLNTDKYISINAEAIDDESGLAESAYSWDNVSWGTDNKTLKVTQNGRYTIYCKDNVGNISSKEIIINDFEVKAQAIINEGVVLKSVTPSTSWVDNINQDVQIIFRNNIDIVAWQITTENVEPSNYVQVKSPGTTENSNRNNSEILQNTLELNTNTAVINNSNNSNYSLSNTYVAVTAPFEAEKTYYVWIKDSVGKVYGQSFRIEKVQY